MIEELLIEKVFEGLKHLYDVDIDVKLVQIQKTRKEFDGDLTLVVFPFLKASKKGPEQTAEDIGAFIQTNINEVIGFNVVKGFLNFSISSDYWMKIFNQISVLKNYGHQASSGKTVMVDLYADWCIACKEFEHYTFNDSRVQTALENTVLIQVDLTDSGSDTSVELMNNFNVFGLPSILFFNTQGEELTQNRVTGFMDAKEFSALLNQIF